jgi:hypothetical protein
LKHLQIFKIHKQIIIHSFKNANKWNFIGVVSKIQFEFL